MRAKTARRWLHIGLGTETPYRVWKSFCSLEHARIFYRAQARPNVESRKTLIRGNPILLIRIPFPCARSPAHFLPPTKDTLTAYRITRLQAIFVKKEKVPV